MVRKKVVLLCLLSLMLALIAVIPAVAQDEFVFGVILVGAKNDGGWSQAHYEGAQYVEANVSGAKMVLFENLNSAVSPEATVEGVAQDMIDAGAKVIFTTSDEFEEDTTAAAAKFPDVTFINVAGDDAYTGEAPANLGNVMGEMEWGKMMAGCAAALTTKTGSIGYVGPLINFETRRLASSAYLGARYCYEKYRGEDPAKLTFTVTWIGFWFNIPGVTADPTEVTNTFFDQGADVVMSGIDTTEALVVAGQKRAEGADVYAVPYDFAGACDLAPEACLGVPYFIWGPAYKGIVEAVQAGTWEQSWDWNGPDWVDITNPDSSAVGFAKGPGLSAENAAWLDTFISEASAYATDEANAGTFFLWQGPLNYQDGTVIAEEGAVPGIAPLGETPSVWYLDQLLEGMTGPSSSGT